MPKPSQQKETVARVMHEFKHGELASSTGRKVTNPKQAIAIGLHEAGASRDETPRKNAENRRKTKDREAQGAIARARDESRGADSKADLYAEARRRNVPGRSHMSKAELRRAVQG
ncbi:hypothetical protein SAMN06265338_10511 [Rhodoblastus acidophilus]|uniref:Plasmid stabilization protein n=1 Tax=Rhodoblastus acidophilus TaxID=1074 RepID=A0A212RK48_RHOAC|nr:DUF6496 domain-containing protein [Rhodoblastus acidophilus]PPQ35081.1 hypothetical protein CKO16_21110 [Rhodoblastus acidophilus]RAI20732.1 hypothetical protein CH337_09430 [Rhodoblastus acidophilus]SNB72804.1 hypothetical protein SAMN06265338_10511 [Rhodoblastus acidophilus]